MQHKYSLFYGWWIVCVGTVTIILSVGVVWKSFTVFFVPLINEFGWGRAELSFAMSLSNLLWIAAPLVGMWVDKSGPQKILLLGAIISGVGFSILSRINSIWQFYTIYFITNIGLLFIIDIPLISMVSRWFIQKRGLAIGILMSGHGIGGLIIAPFSACLITLLGWRNTYLFLGVSALIILVPLIYKVVRQPEDLNLKPYGEPEREKKYDIEGKNTQDEFTLSQTFKLPTFWFITLSFSCLVMAYSSIFVHAVPFLQDMGLSLQSASMFIAGASGVGIAGSTIFGYLSGKFSSKNLIFISILLTTAGVFFLWKSRYSSMLVLFAVLFGFGHGATYTLAPLILGEYFGVASLGSIYGSFWAIVTLAYAVGPLIAGYIFDQTSSYDYAFILFFSLVLAGILSIILARKPFN